MCYLIHRMNKKAVITLIVGLVVLSVIVVVLAKQEANKPNNEGSQNTIAQNEEESMNQELQIEDVEVGDGEEAVAGKEVTVHYTGTFTNGEKFDSSVDRGDPFTFTLGAGQVIEGWDKGVEGMKVGGKRKLTIPPDLGYGPDDYGSIPGGSTLLFDVELLEVN